VEAFEHVAKVFLETQGFAVSTNVKFPVRMRTKKRSHEEYQTHGYEVDFVGARSNELLLGSVKSYFGSHGFSRKSFDKLFFDRPQIWEGILKGVIERFNYPRQQIFFGMFIGHFKGAEKLSTEKYTKEARFGGGKVRLYDLQTILNGVLAEARKGTYFNDPVVVAVKSLLELKPDFRL